MNLLFNAGFENQNTNFIFQNIKIPDCEIPSYLLAPGEVVFPRGVNLDDYFPPIMEIIEERTNTLESEDIH